MDAPPPILRTLLHGLRAKVSARAGQWLDDTRERAVTTALSRWPALAELVADPGKPLRKKRRRPAPKPVERPLDPNGEGYAEAANELLILQLVAAPTWQSRASAAEALAHLDGDGVPEALIRALRDNSVEVAIAAIDALARRPDRTSIHALHIVLNNADGFFSPVTRLAALSALGRLLGDGELGPIVACVRDSDAEVSIAAIAVVADRTRSTAAEHLLPVLQDTSGYFLPLVRLAAANALTRAGALTPDLAQRLLDGERASAVRRVLERVAQCPPA